MSPFPLLFFALLVFFIFFCVVFCTYIHIFFTHYPNVFYQIPVVFSRSLCFFYSWAFE